jgi:hypothetical protein
MMKRYEEATRQVKDFREGQKDFDICTMNLTTKLNFYKSEFDTMANRLLVAETEAKEYKNSSELAFVTMDETIKILRSDLADLKSNKNDLEDNIEKEQKLSCRVRGDLDLKEFEFHSMQKLNHSLSEEIRELELKAYENEQKYNSNLDILERRLNDALEERKR